MLLFLPDMFSHVESIKLSYLGFKPIKIDVLTRKIPAHGSESDDADPRKKHNEMWVSVAYTSMLVCVCRTMCAPVCACARDCNACSCEYV